MGKRRRVDVRSILADPDLRRELMVPTVQATQAREGINTTREQAERAYYVVTEAERAAFFDLAQFWFRGIKPASDRRHEMFVRALRDEPGSVRHDVARRDFSTLTGAPLVYAQVGTFADLFRQHVALGDAWANVRGGMNSTESERFVRNHWEPVATSRREWVSYSKGGEFARFYADLDLVFDWTADGREFRDIVKHKYGSESRFVKSPEFYFKRGITWTEKSYTGFSARILPEGAIFNVAGPAAIPHDYADEWFLLGVLNSSLLSYIAWVLCGRSHGASYIAALPIAEATDERHSRISSLAREIHTAKRLWDQGNEISTGFHGPWLLRDDQDVDASISARLDHLLQYEASEDDRIRGLYAEIDELVYDLYAVPRPTRSTIGEALASRPPELIWPELAGKTLAQKRMEHVCRLLSHVVKLVVEADQDGIVPLALTAGEPSLLERVAQALHTLFPEREAGQVEIEIANELKSGAKGYRRTSSIAEWLENAFFEFHSGLYKNRPVIWHVASAQGTAQSAVGALLDYHRFDRNRMGKLRGQHLRDAIESFRREAAFADRAGETEERVEWQTRLEEAQELDRRLQLIQEGRPGPNAGDPDFRILTPWKSRENRPAGWDPDFDDGVKVNIEPLQVAGVLRIAKVV